MKFTMNRPEFKQLIQKVYRVVPSNPTKPILAGMKITADSKNNQIRLVGTDASTGIIANVKADSDNGLKVAEDGSVVIAARFFKTVVNNMSGKTITLYTKQPKSKQGISTRLKSGRSDFKLNSLYASLYPKLNLSQIGKQTPVEVKGADFKAGINNTAFATSTDMQNVLLTGLHLIFNKDSIKFEATDSHRGSTYTVSAKSALKQPVSQVIPGGNMATVRGMFNSSDDIQIYNNGTNQVIFKQGGLIFYTTTIPGNYPDLSVALQPTVNYVMQLSAPDLYMLAKRAGLVALISNSPILLHLDLTKKQLTVKGESKNSDSFVESVPVKLDRQPKGVKTFDIHLNSQYIQDALGSIGRNDVYVGFTTNNQQCFWSPVKNNNHDFVQFILPVQVKK